MRTTLRIDDQLLRDAKKMAAETGRTLTAVVEDALRQTLASQASPATGKRFRLPRLNLGKTMPGVDIDNSAALLELMDDSNGSV